MADQKPLQRIPAQMKTSAAVVTPLSHTNAPMINRLANIAAGGESYFTDSEAREVVAVLAGEYLNVIAVRACPSAGFTRLAAHNVKSDGYPAGVRFYNGPAL